ncbi:arrestin family membrane adaptor Mug170 [Schizosaccharomyces osmophilus]|uniref:Arrestin family membrane adaptor Mug170 n=1 Tax=Schizosaccharomyces osmophilus TaxID=2545709 RepID=A0AAE9WE54_9SCHI|nr:arrestin family membrane adaptor Mug170 [Schizosaccharomyces osmophilus]WBW74677.1 arrestin family membrane adaptor Mug170 [Schizosaccharomyces osmophilus]
MKILKRLPSCFTNKSPPLLYEKESNSETCSLQSSKSHWGLSEAETLTDGLYDCELNGDFGKTKHLSPALEWRDPLYSGQREKTLFPVTKSPIRKSKLQLLDLSKNKFIDTKNLKLAITLPEGPLYAGTLIKGHIWLSYDPLLDQDDSICMTQLYIDFFGALNLKTATEPFFSVSEKYSLQHALPANQTKPGAFSSNEFGFLLKEPCKFSFPFAFVVPLDLGPGTLKTQKLQLSYSFSATIFFSSLSGEARFTRTSIEKTILPSMNENIASITNKIDCENRIDSKRLETPKLSLRISISRSLFLSGEDVGLSISYNSKSQSVVRSINVYLLEYIQLLKIDSRLNQALKAPPKKTGKVILKRKVTSQDASHYNISPQPGQLYISLRLPESCRSIETNAQIRISYTIKVSLKTVLHSKLTEAYLPITILHA